MKIKIQAGLVAILGLVFAVMPTLAHHSATAEFDVYKTLSTTGTISKVDWINPHTYIYIDVKDEKGNVSALALETWPTGILHRFGIKREMFVIGQPIAVDFNPGKDASKGVGFLRHVKFPNGDEINFKNNAISDNN